MNEVGSRGRTVKTKRTARVKERWKDVGSAKHTESEAPLSWLPIFSLDTEVTLWLEVQEAVDSLIS